MLFHNQARCQAVKIMFKRHSVPTRIRLENNCFGYVLSGALKIHYPEHTVTVHPGEVFFVCAGPHCVEYSDRYSATYLRFDDQAVINALNVLSPRYDILDFPPDTAVSDTVVCQSARIETFLLSAQRRYGTGGFETSTLRTAVIADFP